jgi:hypothetical protein
LPELDQLELLLHQLSGRGRAEVLTTVDAGGQRFPIHAIVLGTEDRAAPTLCVVGGVHGLERIGTKVVLAYLHTLTQLLEWDDLLHASLETTRLAFVPLVNPGGMYLGRRANPRGVDLMRNAPVQGSGVSSFLVGGQRLSPWLPWYMGPAGAPMEPEAQALCEFVRREAFEGEPTIVLDVHSGFGLVDRIWFPYARTRRPFESVAEVYRLNHLLDETLPNHVYRLEPQARNYTVQGDLWDHLYDQHRRTWPDRLFLPLTLEMGSWMWVKKNPRQLLSTRLGSFNPVKPHRLRRTLRRHLLLFDFLHRVTAAASWTSLSESERRGLEAEAFERWFAN